MPEKHHKFSPSKLQQYSICPASFRMQEGIQVDSSNAESEEGTMLHEIVATGDRSKYLELTEEQKDIIRQCYDFLDSEFGGRERCQFEQYLEVTKDGSVITGGTADVVYCNTENDDLCIVDWKFGRIKVPEAKVNIQTATYALGAMQKYQFKHCRVIIFQPRCGFISRYEYHKPEAILNNIANIITSASSTEVMTFHATEYACRFCKAKYNCPSYSMLTKELISAGISEIVTEEAMVTAYEKVKIVEHVCDAIKDKMSKWIDKHGSCGEYVKVTVPGNRECTDIQGIATDLSGVVTPAEFTACCTLSIPKIESLVVDRWKNEYDKKGVKITKINLKKQFNSDFDKYIGRKSSSKIMKKEKSND